MRTAKLICLMLCVMLLTGCWDALHIEQRSLIAVVGVDYLEEAPHYLITLSYPLIDPSRTQESHVMSVRAHSLAEGYAIINHATRGHVSFGKLLLTIFGEEAARQGVAGIINDLFKHPDIRVNSHIVVAKGRAVDVISASPPDGPRIGYYLRDMLDWLDRYGDIASTPLYTFSSNMMIPGMDAETSIIGPIGSLEPRPKDQRGGGGGSSEEGGQSQQNDAASTTNEDIQVLGAALWYGDRMVGEINLPEAQHLSILQARPIYMPLQLLLEGATDFAPVADRLLVYIEQVETKWQLTLANNRPHYKANLKVLISLYNYQGLHNITDEDNAKELEKIISETIRTSCLSVLQKVSAMGSDPLYLGQQFRLTYPQQWEPDKWSEMLQDADFSVECEVSIRLTGYQLERIQPKSGGPN